MPPSPEGPRTLALEGRATIAGRDVRHAAVPAEDMMQAFYYHHLVPVKDCLADVTGNPRPNARAAFTVDAETAVKLPRGGTVSVRVILNAPRLADALRLELDQPPEGIAIQAVETVRDGVAITLRADPAKVKAGLKGNLIVDAFRESAPNPDAKKKQPAAGRRVPLGTLPAIPFEIVENVVARR
jgi:hypothetical protein